MVDISEYPESLINVALPSTRSGKQRIATLGPSGTSSEAAAGQLRLFLGESSENRHEIVLYDQYEWAADAVRGGDASLLLVANAYAHASRFYMDPLLYLRGAFVFDTPLYGLAAGALSPRSGAVQVSSHPAPVPLISELIDPERYQVVDVKHAASTSAAAAAVSRGEADLALTTDVARAAYGLEFVSRIRPIRMLWSVFGLKGHVVADEAERAISRRLPSAHH